MRHRRMVAPINSIKHYVHIENASTASAAIRSLVIVDAVSAPAAGAASEVKEGSIVKAIFLEYWVKSEAAANTDTKFQMMYEKVPAGQVSVTFAQMNNLGAYTNKKNVLYFTQGVLGDTNTDSVPIHRTWFLIPKGKQRMGLGDRIVVSLTATGTAVQNCGFTTFKEYQ